MKKRYSISAALLLFLGVFCFSFADVPKTISYQGVLLENNKNPKPDATYNFVFKLYDTKDVGTGNQQGNYVQNSAVKVENGVFSVLLDFTSFPNLSFDNPIWLDVTVNGEQLSQRVSLASSAYSLGIPDNSVTTSKIRDAAVTSQKIQDNSISTAKLLDGAVTNSKLQDNSVTTSKIVDNSVNSFKLDDYISINQLYVKRFDNDTLNFGYFGNIVDLGSGNSLGGGLFIFGPNGAKQASITSGNAIAGMSGDGSVWGKTKNFVDVDPTDPTRKIRYTSIEGPEAAMYVRGKAKLINGRGIIQLPDHFTALALESSITVTLTPRSFESKGLAIGNISSTNIEVGELFKGSGNYEFDYLVYAVRKGYENYKVYIYPEDMKAVMYKNGDQLNPVIKK
jgi:hypothetical protein